MLRSRVTALILKSLHPPCKSLATASFDPRIQLLPLPGIHAALTAPLVPERFLQEVMGATTAWLCQREGLAEPWAGSRVCPWLHRRCSAALRRGCCEGRSSSGRAQALLSTLHPLPPRRIVSVSFFVLKRLGRGEEKPPKSQAPSGEKATSSPSAAAALTALTPFQARGQALSSV